MREQFAGELLHHDIHQPVRSPTYLMDRRDVRVLDLDGVL
jgi:hypothetical protein